MYTFPDADWKAFTETHGGRLEHNEEYCGSCYGAETVCWSSDVDNVDNLKLQ